MLGPCLKCRKRGHQAEWCRNDPVSLPDLEQAKAAGEKLKKKKKKKGKMKRYSPTRGKPPGPENARANRVNLGASASANNAICRSDLNKKLSSMTEEEIREVFQALRAMKEDSTMTETRLYRKNAGGPAVFSSTCWDTGCTITILHII